MLALNFITSPQSSSEWLWNSFTHHIHSSSLSFILHFLHQNLTSYPSHLFFPFPFLFLCPSLLFSSLFPFCQLMLAVAAHSPTNGEVQVVLGILYNISQDFDNAIDSFRKAIDFSPPNYSLLNKVRHSYSLLRRFSSYVLLLLF